MTSIFEYNKEEEDKKIYQAGVEQGIERGIELGIERGVEQGIECGIEQTKKEWARSLFKLGIPNDKIAEIIGADLDKIKKWQLESEQ